MPDWFDAYYYQHGCGAPYQRDPLLLNAFGSFGERIVREINPGTVLDAGCAMGFLVEALRDRGVEAYGIDISEYAIQQVRQDIQPYCQVGSLITPLTRRYDLITCIEVLEHMPLAEGEQAIACLCAATEDILFSSTPIDYKEATHFNVQSPDYWAYQFALHGFVRDVDFDASFITAWAVRFRRNREPWPRVVRNYERRFSSLWKENADLRSLVLEMRTQSAITGQSIQTLQAQVDRVAASPTWRFIEWLRSRLFPAGSRQESWLTHQLRWLQKRSP